MPCLKVTMKAKTALPSQIHINKDPVGVLFWTFWGHSSSSPMQKIHQCWSIPYYSLCIHVAFVHSAGREAETVSTAAQWMMGVSEIRKIKKRVEDKTYVIQNPQCAPCSIYHDSTSTAPSTCPMLYLSQLNLHSTCRSRGAQAHACILLCGLQFCASAPPPIPSQILKAEWFTHNNWKTIQSNRNVGTKDCSKGRVRTVHRVDWIFSTMVEWKPLFCQLTQSTVHPPHHRPAPVKTDQVRPHNTGNRDSIQKDFGKHADFTKRVETRNRRSVMRTDDSPHRKKTTNKSTAVFISFIFLSFPFSFFFSSIFTRALLSRPFKVP